MTTQTNEVIRAIRALERLPEEDVLEIINCLSCKIKSLKNSHLDHYKMAVDYLDDVSDEFSMRIEELCSF